MLRPCVTTRSVSLIIKKKHPQLLVEGGTRPPGKYLILKYSGHTSLHPDSSPKEKDFPPGFTAAQ